MEDTMATRTICGKTVQVNDEGFMTNPAEWDKDIAVEIAKEEGIAELTPNHWKVIDFSRVEGAKSGKAPTIRQITTGTGLTTKELFSLYPKGPAKKVARISGLGKPEGCV
jgi:tRNA 2-thiouridine synthesizing protein E